MAFPYQSLVTDTPVLHFLVTPSSTSQSLEEYSLELFGLNGQKFGSVNQIFQYICQQPKENRWTVTENLLQFRTTIIRQFEKLVERIWEEIERAKAWEFVDLDKATLKPI